MTPLQKLQDLFRELFQLDLADLDFGIYRLLRLKRDEVEAFLTEQLPRRVRETFAGMAEDERAALERSVAELQGRIRAEVAEDAILSDGEIAPDYRDVKVKAARELLDEYRSARERLAAVAVTEAQQAEVFNHLYNFFSRYYEGGDFIPLRRRGAREAYAVPYNGEETLFHWANRDQHYVKTAEAFRDYAFTVDALGGPFRVRFVLTQASVPPANTKGETRYFFPEPDEIEWDAEAKTLRVPFHYRLPVEKDVQRYGKNARLQEGVLEEAVPKILEGVPDPVLKEALAEVVDRKEDEEVTLLKRRLQRFTRKQTTDYFIHKDLGGFLRRELEFYLKDQVLHIADLDGDLDGKRRTLRVLRELADEVVTFLAQIEDAQKRLFEKRKFVLRTDYLVPIMHVPRELWGQVVANEKQIKAWRDLFAINGVEDFSESFLGTHPTLVVNTEHFDRAFIERLIEGFENIDDATDGLLIRGENYQTLRLLQPRYSATVKCVYIDPPYNTGSDEFVYKDRYRHSSWIAMMAERLGVCHDLLAEDGAIFVSIDDNEVNSLRRLCTNLFGEIAFAALFVAQTNPRGRTLDPYVAKTHEYILSLVKNRIPGALREIPKTEAQRAQYRHQDETGRFRLLELRNRNPMFNRTNRPNLFFPIYVDESSAEVSLSQTERFSVEALPRNARGEDGCWTWGKERVERKREELVARRTRGGVWRIFRKDYLTSEGRTPTTKVKSVWIDREINHENGKEALRHLFGEHVYDFPKSPALLARCFEVGSADGDLTMDFFAGSGTAGHAVLQLARELRGRRRFILVEMAGYFDSVVLPRIQKLIYSPEWRDGKPQQQPGPEDMPWVPRLVKVVRLESYEDALHSVGVDDVVGRTRDRAEAHAAQLGMDQYRIRYLLRLPLEASASMLAIDRFEHPFDYAIEVLTDEGPTSQRVDLVETFNFLYGLHVQQIRTWLNEEDASRRYRVVKGKTRDNRRVLVLWRDMTDFDPVAERHFLEPRIESEGPFDEILINGDCAVPGVQSLDGLFKRLMEEGET